MAITIVKAPLTTKQLLSIGEVTPPDQVYERKGKGGKMFKYVRGSYVKDRLNKIFGWMWDFEVVEHGTEKDLIWVLGKLTVKDMKGHTITKMQFGRSDVKYYRDRSKGTLDFGNDLKAATTDALKKCASELGIARDIYSQQEIQEIKEVDRTYIVPEAEEAEVKEAPLLATEIDKKRIVEVAKQLGATTPSAVGKLVENTMKKKIDWGKMTKNEATTIYAALLQKKLNKK